MRVGMRSAMKAPATAELRNPVTVVSVKRVPDGGTGFTTELHKQFDAWAKISHVTGDVKDGQSETPQSEVTHAFIMRAHPSLPRPDIAWHILHAGRLYRVLDVYEVTQRGYFWGIATNDEGPLADYRWDDVRTPQTPHSNDDNAEPEPKQDEGFPMWG